MTTDLLIGIDLGTTVLKIAAFTTRGKQLASESIRLKIQTQTDGTREQDATTLLPALKKAFRKLLVDLSSTSYSFKGIGLAAQGGSFVCADPKTGRACSPMVLWNDMRGFQHRDDIAAQKEKRFWYPRSYENGPVVGLAKLRHHSRNHPEWFDGTVCVGAGSFLYFHLTDRWQQEAGQAIQIGCYDWLHDKLDHDGFAAAGISHIQVPPMRDGHSVNPLAPKWLKELGLSSSIPVAGPYMDHEAGYMSACSLVKKPLQCSLGTAWVGNAVLPADFQRTMPLQILMPSPAGNGRLCVFPIRAGNQTWDWAMDTFVGGTQKTHLAKANHILDSHPLPENGLVALPFIYSPNPVDSAKLGGVSFIGAGFHTDNAEFLRAVAAGLASEFHYSIERCYGKTSFKNIVLGGGISKSPIICKLLAALFSPLPVYVDEDSDSAGVWGSVSRMGEGVPKRKLIRVKRPGKKFSDPLNDYYERYQKARKALYQD